mmetsp:Transcript_45146/g.107401  ORF Transcript_45146/g.107401 Transcript_45146/m.107401 type:complete len:685 (-) Transcript_45146:126-2180(-)
MEPARPDDSIQSSGFFRELADLDVARIRDYLDLCSQPFEASEVYVVSEGQNIIDTGRRRSEFRRIRAAELFDLLTPVVAKLSSDDPLYSYILVRNDITEVQYKEGGFFGRHQDYLSLTSNLVEEFSLLLCVTPSELAAAVRGGETVLHLHSGSHQSSATVTPGSALAFRKDVEHESKVLEAGEKHILMMNLWACRKTEASSRTLLVTFTDAEGAPPKVLQRQAVSQLATGEWYSIPIEEAMQSQKLAEEIAQAPHKAGVLHLECSDCDFTAFATIYRILRRMHVSASELREHAALITRYGLSAQSVLVEPDYEDPAHGKDSEEKQTEPQGSEDVPSRGDQQYSVSINMMDGSVHVFEVLPSDTVHSLQMLLQERVGKRGLQLISVEGGGESRSLSENRTLDDYERPSELSAVKKRLKVDEYRFLRLSSDEMMELSEPHPDSQCHDPGSDVIVCDSLSRTEVIAQAALTADMPYIIFQSIWVEGELSVHGDTCRPGEYSFAMHPAFICLGDARHIFTWSHCNWWESQASLQYERKPEPTFFDLSRVLRPDADIREVMTSVIFDKRSEYYNNNWREPDARDLTVVARANADEVDEDELTLRGGADRLFHINPAGQSCFSKSEAAAAVHRLQEMDFTAQVLSRINKVPFELPQHESAQQITFCNEQVYAKLNLLHVSGVVRLSGAQC